MYSGDDYYSRQIAKVEEMKKIASLAICVSFELIKFNKDNIKNKLDDKINDFFKADEVKAEKIRTKIVNELDHTKKTIPTVELATLGELFRKNYFRWQLSLDRESALSLAKEIQRDPIEALKRYTRKHIQAKSQIRSLNEQRAKDLANVQQEKQQENVYKNEPKETTPFVGGTDEESRRLLEEEIERKTHQKYMDYFTEEEKKRIAVLYPELSGKDGYRTVEMLENGIRMNIYANREIIKSDQVMEMALLTLKIACNELIFGSNGKATPPMFYKLEMNQSLEKYKIVYDKYIKYYNSLNSQEKANVNDYISNNKFYTERFGTSIVSPEQLKSEINKTVKNYIINNHKKFYGNSDIDYFSKTYNATKLMSVDEIVSLYYGVRSQENKDSGYISTDEQYNKRVRAEQKDRLGRLQSAYAKVLLFKLEEYNKSKDVFKMTEEEKEINETEEAKKLASICEEILNEKPMTEYLIMKTRNENIEGLGKELKETHEIKTSARNRAFNISKLRKVQSQITGEWAKYLMLMEKEKLNKSEKEDLNGMFR